MSNFSFLKTDWGVIGTATPNGWNSDTPLTYNDLAKTWNVTLDLVAGEIKFRANGSWDLNYGDDGPDGFLDQDGATIVVNAAGSYTITLDFSIPEYRYTIVKN